ncbi:hypothetical protein [Janthinobacterium sp. RB2R34]|uniref:hypothetical protein n=1 Tax=Janthinobacterium sp. RB2R34 TaxID=3424193 RepID=UPI003F211221
MTSISPIASWNAGTLRGTATATATAIASREETTSLPVTTSSSIVALGAAAAQGATQTAAAPLQWERASRDQVSELMAKNFSAGSGAGRFSGLGAALLDQLKGGVTQLSQTAQRAPNGTQAATYAGIATGVSGALHGMGDDKFSLGITTRSGVEVKLSLDSDGDALAVQMTASGELTEDETRALGQLSKAFQEAIDGMAQDPPQLRLAGLMQFDAKQLASIDLRAQVGLDTQPPSVQTLSFQADATQRKVAFSGAAGSLDVKVDASQAASLGGPEQQARALKSYMSQFDQAATRGHADGALMGLFKDTFSALHSPVGEAAKLSTSGATPGKWALAAQDRAMLTGLADFSASVSQTPKMENPMRLSEQDAFNYEVGQRTSLAGRSYDDRSISQQQTASLSASFHMPLVAGTSLRLTSAAESQNYTYHQIEDTASSLASIAYQGGKLSKASLEQSSSQSTRVQRYEMGKLKSDLTTPSQHALMRDLVAALGPYQAGQAQLNQEQKAQQRTQMLSALNDDVFLTATAGK